MTKFDDWVRGVELGHRALALVLKHEWSASDGIGGSACQECSGQIEHERDCEWAAIVAEAKKLQGGP